MEFFNFSFRIFPVLIYFGIFTYLIYRENMKFLRGFVISFLVYSVMVALFALT